MDRTNRLHLPLFESTDKPSWLTDWNLAMTILDDAISDLEIGGIPNLAELLERLSNIESKQASDETIMQTIASCFANNFSSAITYSKGDLVLYENSLYEYTYNTPSSGDFDGTKWSSRQLEDLLGAIKDSIGSLGIQTSELATGLSALESSVSSLRTTVNNVSDKADSAETKADNALTTAESLESSVTSLQNTVKSKKSAFVIPYSGNITRVGFLPNLTTMTASGYSYKLECPILTQFPNAGLNETDLYRFAIGFTTPVITVRFNSAIDFAFLRLTIGIKQPISNTYLFEILSKDFYFANVKTNTDYFIRPDDHSDNKIVAPFFNKLSSTNETSVIITLEGNTPTQRLGTNFYSITNQTGNISLHKVQTHSS